jgi:hypothetical protein
MFGEEYCDDGVVEDLCTGLSPQVTSEDFLAEGSKKVL